MNNWIYFLLIFLSITIINGSDIKLKTRINTQKKYIESTINNDLLYGINLKRTQSSFEQSFSACQARQKSIKIKHTEQLFRLKKLPQNTRHQTIYEKLTTLDDDENIISNFAFIGENIFIVTTTGKCYFLQKNGKILSSIKIDKKYEYPNEIFSKIIIKNHQDRALIISRQFIVLCDKAQTVCENISGYQSLLNIKQAELYKFSQINYLFITNGSSLFTYELAANNKLVNKTIISAQNLGIKKMQIADIKHSKSNTFYLLDMINGLYEIKYQDRMNNFLKNPKKIHPQQGCSNIYLNNDESIILLKCQFNYKNEFIIKIFHDKKDFNSYFVAQMINIRHQMLDVSIYNKNVIMVHSISGIKMFWTSLSKSYQYPHQFNHAGTLFLHNAKNYISINQSLYLSSDDQLIKYTLQTTQADILCHSFMSVTEQYNIMYTYYCDNDKNKYQCTSQKTLSYQSNDFRQITFLTMLFPFIISLLSFFIILLLTFRVYKTMKKQIKQNRQKYDSSNEFELN